MGGHVAEGTKGASQTSGAREPTSSKERVGTAQPGRTEPPGGQALGDSAPIQDAPFVGSWQSCGPGGCLARLINLTVYSY